MIRSDLAGAELEPESGSWSEQRAVPEGGIPGILNPLAGTLIIQDFAELFLLLDLASSDGSLDDGPSSEEPTAEGCDLVHVLSESRETNLGPC